MGHENGGWMNDDQRSVVRSQLVRYALDEKREQLKGKVTGLVLCKRELFYLPSPGNGSDDSVYPVSREVAAKEAEFFGCDWSEE